MKYIIVLALVSLSISLQAQYSGREEKQILKMMHDLSVPGVQISHIKGGKTQTYNLGEMLYGSTDKVTDVTLFQAASMSKVVFAYAVLRLYDQGLIELDRPLNEYYTDKKLKDDPNVDLITARMCLNHTTGLPNWGTYGEPLRTRFKPGTAYRYSGEGIQYLQRTIEHITGKTLEEIMQQEVIQPLGLTHSSFVYHDSLAADYATGHDGKTGMLPSKMRKFSRAKAAYSMLTTAQDYAAFVQKAVLGGQGLKPETHKLWLSPSSRLKQAEDTKNPAFEHLSYGLGIMLQDNEKGRAYMHTGSNRGRYMSIFISYPETGEVLVALTNGKNGGTPFQRALLTYLLEPQTLWFFKR